MGNKYRKKPIVIEAFQMTKERHLDRSEWPKWLNAAWEKDDDDKGSLWRYPSPSNMDNQMFISTLEGTLQVSWNTWIIQGIKGEIYPCKPDIFEQICEPVGVHPSE